MTFVHIDKHIPRDNFYAFQSLFIMHCSKFLVKKVFLSTVVIAFVGESIACSLLLCAEEEPMYEGGNFCRLLSTPLPELRQEVNAVL